MLEELANFDDHLLEELLEEITRPKKKSPRLKAGIKADLVVPVLFGVATGLWSTASLDALLRKPQNQKPQQNLGIAHADTPLAQVLKTYFTSQGGKIAGASLAGKLTDGIEWSSCWWSLSVNGAATTAVA